MADNLKFSDAALALLKANLGYYDSTIPADLLKYLTYLLTYALDSFAGMGIVLSPGVLEDDMDQMTYAAYLYRHGVTGAGKTEMLRQIIRDRKVRAATVSLLSMPDTTGVPSPGCLVPVFDAWCAEKTVYAKRFWEALANGSRVDKLVELPLHRDVPSASYARLGGHTYRVEQILTGEVGDGLPVTWLSLMRMEDAYDTY